MVEDSTIILIAKINYEPLCNVKTLLALAYVLTLLEVVQGFSKFAQGHHIHLRFCGYSQAL